ncbi:putative WRKY transcription factor 43 [Salvia divinorum]|uniref:WRKY transcription factor 43 n=1 Tax=Salvia divinorum TaxID=28513 RepID=A0ABD1GWF3_SALDI
MEDHSSSNLFPTASPSSNLFPTASPSSNLFPTASPSSNLFPTASSSSNLFPTASPSSNLFPTASSSSNLFPTAASSSLLEGFDMGFKRERSYVAENPKTAAERFLSEENCDGMMMMKKNKKSEKKVKRPRFAFQTKSSVDILDDGYRWRKYGQKAVKNNKFPRSYYRCTREGCNVKKQVQRLSRDESVVVTTYEGRHTHPVDKPSDNFQEILSQMQIYPTV